MVLGECLPANPIRRSIAQASDLLLHPVPLRDRSSTNSSIKRRNSTRSVSSLFVFIIPKTLNQRGLLFRSAAHNRLETALHGTGAQTILVFNCDCYHQPLLYLKYLVGMLSEDCPDNAPGGLAGDYQPSYGHCPSPRGRAPRRGVVRRNSARQLRY